jgi:hypothetical protein
VVTKKSEDTLRVVGVKPSTIAMVQGTFALLVGLVAAIMFSISSTVHWAQETESVLRGLTFGLASGFIAIIGVPIVYFMAGWLLGWFQGVVINAIISMSGGIVLKTENK